MITCKNCGTQLADHCAFCNVCGTPVAGVQQTQPEVNAASGQPVQPEVNVTAGQPVQPVQPEVNVAAGQPEVNVTPVQSVQQNPDMAYQQPVQQNQNMGYQQPVQQNQNMGYQQPVQQNPNHDKKVGIIVSVIVVAILAVIGLLVYKVFSGNDSYERAVKQYVKGIQEHDLQELAQACPKEMREDIIDSYMGGWYSDEDEFWEEFDEWLEYYCGDHVKITYRIESVEELDEYDIDYMELELETEYDYKCNISEAYEVEVIMVCKGSEDTYEESMYLDVAKIKGHWYVVYV